MCGEPDNLFEREVLSILFECFRVKPDTSFEVNEDFFLGTLIFRLRLKFPEISVNFIRNFWESLKPLEAELKKSFLGASDQDAKKLLLEIQSTLVSCSEHILQFVCPVDSCWENSYVW